jgi:3-oxoacyl-[acyl-carrier protein] reductase
LSASQELAGKVAVITGGSGAIGAVIRDTLTGAGARAISFDLVPPRGSQALFVRCDVRDEASVGAAIQSVRAEQGHIDLVIHAAGVSRDAVLWKLSAEDWNLVLDVNLRGAFYLLRHATPALRAANGGRVIFIGSINGSRGKFGTSAYSASKAGLLGLAKTAARELARFGVLVNVIEPGWVRTPMTEATPQSSRNAALAESLVGSFLEPEDVASAVLFLCGTGAKRITGQILRVDGGQFLGPV